MQESGTAIDDASVIARSLRDPEAFSILFVRHGARIQRYVTRRIGPDAAEDVVAETFLLAFRQRDRYDLAHASALPWLYGIASASTFLRGTCMNDMDLLASFRADVPEFPVSPETERRLHAALHQSKGRFPVPRVARLALHSRRVFLASLAIGAAAALVLGLVAGHAGTSTPPAASSGQTSLTVRLVADRAAAAALDQPAVRPGQWVYRLIQYKQVGFAGGLPPDSTETTWTTADGTLGHVGGPAILPLLPALPYAKLGSLPSDPAALERYLADQPVSGFPGLRTNDKAAKAFDEIMGLLWNYVLPPKLAAELYRALTDIPGVTVNAHATDIAGRPGIAFELSNSYGPGTEQQLILNPSDYALMAVGSTDTTGARAIQLAVLRQAFVSRPGDRG